MNWGTYRYMRTLWQLGLSESSLTTQLYYLVSTIQGGRVLSLIFFFSLKIQNFEFSKYSALTNYNPYVPPKVGHFDLSCFLMNHHAVDFCIKFVININWNKIRNWVLFWKKNPWIGVSFFTTKNQWNGVKI